jgi:anti-sigma regulatory factor (Ser/Thr protein kinase)
VSAVRRFVEEVAERLGADADLSARIAMTAHELLENVAKYGQDRRGVLSLEGTSDGDKRRLTITVKNATSAAHVDRLKRVFNEMEGVADPFTHYFMVMRREVEGNESGLGLARIRAA